MTDGNSWVGHIPPYDWPRFLAMDVGGASPNALIWFAKDPESKAIIAYDEICEVSTDMRSLAQKALPKMKDPDGRSYKFDFKVGDYENRVALDEMGRNGIKFDNAVKHNKLLSVHKFASYLHPNPKRPFPLWHPSAGKLGSPLFFVTPNCKNLIKEIPQQRWKTGLGDSVKDEMDRNIRHDTVDCCLYVARMLPAVTEIPIPKITMKENPVNVQSRMYWLDVQKREADRSGEARQKYNPSHVLGGIKWPTSLSQS